MHSLIIKIVNQSQNPLPHYATKGAAGMDICASLENDCVLKPLERMLVPTGMYVEIPSGYEIQIRPRSGLAIKNGITCLNTPGTIDSDYRGEIKVILINLSAESHTLKNGERIAQMVVCKVEKAAWHSVEILEISERGEGGFGHTGMR